jgi:hypothetical protein
MKLSMFLAQIENNCSGFVSDFARYRTRRLQVATAGVRLPKRRWVDNLPGNRDYSPRDAQHSPNCP